MFKTLCLVMVWCLAFNSFAQTTNCQRNAMSVCMNSSWGEREAKSSYMTKSEYCALIAIEECK